MLERENKEEECISIKDALYRAYKIGREEGTL